MRELKFRAWNTKSKGWVIDPFQSAQDRKDGSFGFDQKRNVIMQCLGVSDRNGTEIYCSDIVRGRFDIDMVEDWMWLQLTDEEQKTGIKDFIIPEDITEAARMQLPHDLEVIGNIYENPELLTAIAESKEEA